jgi:hypothetical protein
MVWLPLLLRPRLKGSRTNTVEIAKVIYANAEARDSQTAGVLAKGLLDKLHAVCKHLRVRID